MELKQERAEPTAEVSEAFNRTILELKHIVRNIQLKIAFSFNRTILELKPGYLFTVTEGDVTFNRTILELKQETGGEATAEPPLLIEPFWN